jgi:UDP-3-O-[3-hydroxymyristoyl] glucosamine N-acyltransferase
MITATLGQLAELVQGKLIGDPNLVITGAATVQEALPGEITFVDHPKLRGRIETSSAAAVVVPADWEPVGHASLHVQQVRASFAAIVRFFRPPLQLPRQGISTTAQIHPSACLAEDVEVHPYAVVGPQVQIGRGSVVHSHVSIMGRCQIGEDVTLYPGVVLYRDTVVGDRAIIHAHAVIGAHGFGYETVQGRHLPGDQLGYVVLESDVEIGAGTTVDRGTYGPTVIGSGSKLDNQVMIAHNCRLGKHNLICSQVGVAGSSTSGDYVVMAGQVGVPDHVRIGNRVVLGAKSGVMRDVPDDSTYIGIPATPERDQMAMQAALAKLPELRRQVRSLVRHVEQLTGQVTRLQAGSHEQSDAA